MTISWVMPMECVDVTIKTYFPGIRIVTEHWEQRRPEIDEWTYITWTFSVQQRWKTLWPKFWKKGWVQTYPAHKGRRL